MEPTYFLENRHSFVVDKLAELAHADYEVETPEGRFERDVQRQLALANRLLMTGKYSAALAKYRHVRGLIAATLRPQLSVANGALVDHASIDVTAFSTPMLAKSVVLLKATPVGESEIPGKFREASVSLPASLTRQFASAEAAGIQDNSAGLSGAIDGALAFLQDGQFGQAAAQLTSATQQTADKEIQAALLHDLAIVREREGKRDEAAQLMDRSLQAVQQAASPELHVAVLTSLASMQLRGANRTQAGATLERAATLRRDSHLFSIAAPTAVATTRAQAPSLIAGQLGVRSLALAAPSIIGATPSASGAIPLRPDVLPTRGGGGAATAVSVPATAAASATAVALTTVDQLEALPVQLLSAAAFARRTTTKEMTIVGANASPGVHRVRLDANASNDLGRFYTTLQTTRDVGLLMTYLQNPATTVVYLNHVYCCVIPIAVGDCLAALGSYEEAEREYLVPLKYPFLNRPIETVNLWLRLAEMYLDWGDRLYRQARNDVSAYGEAREKYERVLLLDNTLNPRSPLYAAPAFADVMQRVKTAVHTSFVTRAPSSENPRLLMVIHRARAQIFKIESGLNFIGVGVHIPPFSFEYLQNLARYFAQHASQVEQMYIQFKSTGENEALREQQMAQQSELATASVELERRGLAEAAEGVDVASANFNYTNVQLNNASRLRDQFSSVQAELQEISRLQAWAGAVSNDEVELNVVHASYYSASSKKRSHVLFDLASRRAQISNQIESTRLQNEVNAANAYRGVAQQQIEQARARVEVAEQRVAIAQLQQRHSSENLAFLGAREFSSAMWYNLAREARRLTQRYVDMAIEVATLMEKAYEAETGRDLAKIKFDYGLEGNSSLLGAEQLLLDIDYFSLDFIRTKSKKAQLKQVISLADLYPAAFNRLIESGQTFFETTLEHFDRRYPGFYLQKVRQVEVVFVGLNGTEGVHGSLRNIGLSKFRSKTGAVVSRSYPADVMPLSEYDVKQDAIVFQLDSKELRLFENSGIATMWQLDLPLSTNTFDLAQILDVQVVFYYDGFFDSGLEQEIIATLPASGSAARSLGLRLYAPDELFFLKSQGQAKLDVTRELFPANQTGQVLAGYGIRAVGNPALVGGLKLEIEFAALGSTHTFVLDRDGRADTSTFAAPVGQSLFGAWNISIDPAENAGRNLEELEDLAVYLEYDFDYRTGGQP